MVPKRAMRVIAHPVTRTCLTTAAVLGFLISVALCGLSMRGAGVATTTDRSLTKGFTFRGALWIQFAFYHEQRPREIRGYTRLFDSRFNHIGFRYYWHHAVVPGMYLHRSMVIARVTQLRVPLWIPIVLCGVYSAWSLVNLWKTTRRRRANACVQCGYDLTGTPQRCPECGLPVAARASLPGGG